MNHIEEKRDKMKYRLADAMKSCMGKMSVEKITVKEIVDACGTTRQTFYRNFQDKYDLINWYFDKILLESFEHMGQGKTIYEGLVRKFQYIEQESAFFRAAFRTDEQNCLKEHDFELILQFYKDLIARRTSRPLGEELQFLLEMYCQGSVYMTVKWILTGMKDTPEAMAVKLVEAMPPKLAKVMEELGLV